MGHDDDESPGQMFCRGAVAWWLIIQPLVLAGWLAQKWWGDAPPPPIEFVLITPAVIAFGGMALTVFAVGRKAEAEAAAAVPPPLSPADELAAARADSAAQIDAVRAEIAERDAQRRREMDERIAQMRSTAQQAPADGWE